MRFEKSEAFDAERNIKEKNVINNTKTYKNWLKNVNIQNDESTSYDRVSISEHEYCIIFTYKPPQDKYGAPITTILDKTIDVFEFDVNLPKALNTIMRFKRENHQS